LPSPWGMSWLMRVCTSWSLTW